MVLETRRVFCSQHSPRVVRAALASGSRVEGVNFYEHWIGAYRKKTAALDMTEHGAYRALLDEYFAMEKPLPADFSSLFRIGNAIKKREKNAIVSVAEKYFPVQPDGFRHNDFADEQLSKLSKRIETARENGAKGGRPPKENPPGSKDKPAGVPGGVPAGVPAGKARHKTQDIELQEQGVPSEPVGLAPDPADQGASDTTPKVNGRHPSGYTAELGREARSILQLLNEKAGKRFPASTTNVGIIIARLREGFTGNEVRQVVAMKVRAWNGDEKMRAYLRPETLFGRSKFSNYVGELEHVDIPPDDDTPSGDPIPEGSEP